MFSKSSSSSNSNTAAKSRRSWATEAETALDQSRWYDAETLLQEGLAKNPNDIYVLLNLGVVNQKTGRPDQARGFYEQALSLKTPEAESSYGQELKRIAKGNMDLLRSNPFGAASNTPATNTAAATTPAANTTTSPAGGTTPNATTAAGAAAEGNAPGRASEARALATRLAAQVNTTPIAPLAATPAVETPATVAAAAAATNARAGAQTGANASALSAETQTQIGAELQKWTAAWSGKNLDGYYAQYVPDFKGTLFASNKAWKDARAQAIGNRTSIKVDISDLKYTAVDANKVRVDFKQSYHADALKETSKRSVTVVKQNNRWLIQQESQR